MVSVRSVIKATILSNLPPHLQQGSAVASVGGMDVMADIRTLIRFTSRLLFGDAPTTTLPRHNFASGYHTTTDAKIIKRLTAASARTKRKHLRRH